MDAVNIKRRLTRVIEEGVYNIKVEDYTESGELAHSRVMSEDSDGSDHTVVDGEIRPRRKGAKTAPKEQGGACA